MDRTVHIFVTADIAQGKSSRHFNIELANIGLRWLLQKLIHFR
jgi:hypothetical protein